MFIPKLVLIMMMIIIVMITMLKTYSLNIRTGVFKRRFFAIELNIRTGVFKMKIFRH